MAQTVDTNYPKWVTAHTSHITTLADGRKIAAKWSQSFETRTGVVQVLVNNKAEETKATTAATAI